MKLRKFIITTVKKKRLPQHPTGTSARRFSGRTFSSFSLQFLFVSVFASVFTFSVSARKIAILTPDETVPSQNYAAEIGKKISPDFVVLDASLSKTAYRFAAYEVENPFNLSLEEAVNVGRAIGCHYFLLIKHETLRRASLKKDDYYESYAAVYAVSSRTGNLVFWKLSSYESDKPSEAEKKLFESSADLAKEISAALQRANIIENAPTEKENVEEPPPEDLPEAKNFRPPLPYLRISPAYTPMANFYGVEATVDISVDIDETGKVLQTKIKRWAGYGLDESVAEAVRKMNWRPAERNGKPLRTRILLRYNFKDIKNDD